MQKKVNEEALVEVRKAYEISGDIQNTISAIIENGGECSDEQLAILNGLQMELADKAQQICHVRKMIEGNLEYWKAAKAYADEKVKAREKAMKWLSDYLCRCMAQADIESIGKDSKTNKCLYTITRCKGRPSIVVDDVNALDIGFFEVVRKPISKAIKEAIDSGATVNGAHIEMGDDYVMIRQGKSDDNQMQ